MSNNNGKKLEIVMDEMGQLKMSADFFANTSHDICRCLDGHNGFPRMQWAAASTG